ncbi:MAG: hypothetical protein IJU93_08210 [Lachnospiraceae bacterium]|nr:hypothetical protein [Lachnospiraceae bacterium]
MKKGLRLLDDFRRDSGHCLWPAVMISFMLCIYAPLTYFITSRENFWFDFYDMMPPLLLAFVVLAAVVFALNALVWLFCRLSGMKAFGWWVVFELVEWLYIYIQGNFLVRNLPVLNGEDVPWQEQKYQNEIVLGYVVLIALCAVAVLVVLKLHLYRVLKAITPICIAFTAFMLLTTCLSAIPDYKQILKRNDIPVVTRDNLMNYSSQKNFIILLTDYTDSKVMQETLDKYPEDYRIFDGFTYYRNMQGMYPFTRFAFVQLVSGETYENKGAYADFLTRALNESPLLLEAEKRGYRLDAYVKDWLSFYQDPKGYTRFSNVYSGEARISSVGDFLYHWARMVGFRYLPYGLKKNITLRQDEFSDLMSVGAGGQERELYDWLDPAFYHILNTEKAEKTEEPVFKLIHISGAHPPFRLNRNVEYFEGEPSYESNMEATVTVIRRYLEFLKESDLFDNSVILIMADHGDSRNIGNRPIFFVKGYEEETHEIDISQAPVSYEDLQETYRRLLDGHSGGEGLFDWKEGDYRERRYLLYNNPLRTTRISEHLLYGHVDDQDSLKPTGVVYDYFELN